MTPLTVSSNTFVSNLADLPFHIFLSQNFDHIHGHIETGRRSIVKKTRIPTQLSLTQWETSKIQNVREKKQKTRPLGPSWRLVCVAVRSYPPERPNSRDFEFSHTHEGILRPTCTILLTCTTYAHTHEMQTK